MGDRTLIGAVPAPAHFKAADAKRVDEVGKELVARQQRTKVKRQLPAR
jgi:hypothetical protein